LIVEEAKTVFAKSWWPKSYDSSQPELVWDLVRKLFCCSRISNYGASTVVFLHKSICFRTGPLKKFQYEPVTTLKLKYYQQLLGVIGFMTYWTTSVVMQFKFMLNFYT